MGMVRFVTVLAVLSLMLPAGCARDRYTSPESAGGSVETSSTRTVRLATLPYLSGVVLAIATDAGFFAAEGINIEPVVVGNTAEMVAAIAQGQLDAAMMAPNAAFFNTIGAGVAMKLVLPLSVYVPQECVYAGIVARAADVEAGRFADAAGWRGSRTTNSGASFPGITNYITDQVLRSFGLTLDDVELVVVSSPVMEEALRSGQVDTVFAIEPQVTQMTARGDLVVVTPAEQFVDGLAVSFIAYANRLLEDEELAHRFAVAYLRAVRRYMEGKTTENLEVVKIHTSFDEALASSVCWSYSPVDGHMNVNSVLEYQEWLNERGTLDRMVSADEFIDTRYLETALKKLDE